LVGGFLAPSVWQDGLVNFWAVVSLYAGLCLWAARKQFADASITHPLTAEATRRIILAVSEAFAAIHEWLFFVAHEFADKC
jgi:hypothetical protein